MRSLLIRALSACFGCASDTQLLPRKLAGLCSQAWGGLLLEHTMLLVCVQSGAVIARH